jgi:hypothetical protein
VADNDGRPTGLWVLIDGRLVDVDAGAVLPRDVWERLQPVAGSPISVVRSHTDQVGPARIEPAETVGDLPGGPQVLLVTGAQVRLAASTDGRSVRSWSVARRGQVTAVATPASSRGSGRSDRYRGSRDRHRRAFGMRRAP